MKTGIYAILFFIALAACTTPPHRQQFPELTYNYLPLFKLNVAQINIVDSNLQGDAPGHVEKSFPQIPADVMRRWANDRLQAKGNAGYARFTIVRADAIDVPLPRTTGLSGTFTTDQSDKYELTLEARIDVAIPGRTGGAYAKSFVSQTVAENATLNDREAVWFQMTDQAMKALNTELERQINTNLGAFLLP